MFKNPCAFDLETIANKTMIDILPECLPAGNLKDPEKIKADIDKKKKAQIAEMGMEPMTNIICCAGWMDLSGEGHSIILKNESPEAEKELLENFWEVISGYDHFVTFNGRVFDMRCLLLHGMKFGVRPSIKIDTGKYNRGNHTDLRPVLAGEGRFAKGKLDFFAKTFLNDQKTEGMTGDQVQDYWDMQLYEDIQKYCIQDSSLTFRLFQLAETAGLLE